MQTAKKWTLRTAVAALLAAWALFIEGTASLEVTVVASIPAALFLVGWLVGKIKGLFAPAALVLAVSVLVLAPACSTYQTYKTFHPNAVHLDVTIPQEAVEAAIRTAGPPPAETPENAEALAQWAKSHGFLIFNLFFTLSDGATQETSPETDAKLEATVTPKALP